LFFPSDGGYAFATVISAEGQGGMTSPTDEYWGDEDEDDD
jgi:hypothetical protein